MSPERTECTVAKVATSGGGIERADMFSYKFAGLNKRGEERWRREGLVLVLSLVMI